MGMGARLNAAKKIRNKDNCKFFSSLHFPSNIFSYRSTNLHNGFGGELTFTQEVRQWDMWWRGDRDGGWRKKSINFCSLQGNSREIKMHVQDVSCSLYIAYWISILCIQSHTDTSPHKYNSRRSKGQKLFVSSQRGFLAQIRWLQQKPKWPEGAAGRVAPLPKVATFSLFLSLSLFSPPKHIHTQTHACGHSHSLMTACQNCVFTARRET